MVSEPERISTLEAEAIARDDEVARLAAEVDGLHKAMASRGVIEQAKGVLMHSMKVGPDAAFAVLVAVSQRENVKLAEVAARLAGAQEKKPE